MTCTFNRFLAPCLFSLFMGIVTEFYLPVCSQGDIRLRGGANNRTGRLEVCNANEWGTVCDTFFDSADAQVACKQLGFSDAGQAHVNS